MSSRKPSRVKKQVSLPLTARRQTFTTNVRSLEFCHALPRNGVRTTFGTRKGVACLLRNRGAFSVPGRGAVKSPGGGPGRVARHSARHFAAGRGLDDSLTVVEPAFFATER